MLFRSGTSSSAPSDAELGRDHPAATVAGAGREVGHGHRPLDPSVGPVEASSERRTTVHRRIVVDDGEGPAAGAVQVVEGGERHPLRPVGAAVAEVEGPGEGSAGGREAEVRALCTALQLFV